MRGPPHAAARAAAFCIHVLRRRSGGRLRACGEWFSTGPRRQMGQVERRVARGRSGLLLRTCTRATRLRGRVLCACGTGASLMGHQSSIVNRHSSSRVLASVGWVERGTPVSRTGTSVARNPSWWHVSVMGYVRHTAISLGLPERTPPILRRRRRRRRRRRTAPPTREAKIT